MKRVAEAFPLHSSLFRVDAAFSVVVAVFVVVSIVDLVGLCVCVCVSFVSSVAFSVVFFLLHRLYAPLLRWWFMLSRRWHFPLLGRRCICHLLSPLTRHPWSPFLLLFLLLLLMLLLSLSVVVVLLSSSRRATRPTKGPPASTTTSIGLSQHISTLEISPKLCR